HLESAHRATTPPLPFANTPDISIVATPAPPKKTSGTVITTTTTGTGTGRTTITTTTSTALGTAMTEGQNSIAQQQPYTRNSFTFTEVRRLIGMIYQSTKTLMPSSSLTRYALLGFVLAVLLAGWMDCTDSNNNNNNNNVFDQHQPPNMDHM